MLRAALPASFSFNGLELLWHFAGKMEQIARRRYVMDNNCRAQGVVMG